MIYLACPYSHPLEGVRKARFRAANIIAAKLMAEGHVALLGGRKFLGFELKESYYTQAALNLERASVDSKKPNQVGLDMFNARFESCKRL